MGCEAFDDASKSDYFIPVPRKGYPITATNGSRPDCDAQLQDLLLLLSGDVEQNPGPIYTCSICSSQIKRTHHSIRCNAGTQEHWLHIKCVALNIQNYTHTWTCTNHTHTPTPPQQQPQPKKNPPKKKQALHILQLNANGLTNKITELEHTAQKHNIDIISIQESKLQQQHKTPKIHNFVPIRTDRNRRGGGIITYIKNDITFTHLKTPNNINTEFTELHTTKIHLSQKKHIHITNIYIPPHNSTDPHQRNEDLDVTNAMTYASTLTNSIITGDVNAHSTMWFSHTDDHRGQLIADILQNSPHITLNTDNPTRQPTNNN